MEKLKKTIPKELKQKIQQSTSSQLPSTCSSLFHLFSHSSLFHSMIKDLTDTQMGLCGKNKESALELKNHGNSCFSANEFSQALLFYSQALRVAPVDAVDKDNKLVATLYVNRASSLHKLNLLKESIRDCTRAISISPCYVKAWYRRGKVNASLSNYEEAVHDLKVAMKMEGTCKGKSQIECDLKSIASQNWTTNSASKFIRKNPLPIDEEPQAKLNCVTTPTKGRGMVSPSDIPSATLVHREEPYAAIILKNCRETHCHYCFNELPADTVPCRLCSTPLYCSDHCQLRAGGQRSRSCSTDNRNDDILSGELQSSFSTVALHNHSDSEVECFAEHRHECHGVNWPAVLPSEVVLAGRIIVKLLESKGINDSSKNLDLSHNYVQLPPESKLELHVYSAVLLYCLHYSYESEVELSGASIAKVVVLISQVKVNSMAVVLMKNLNIPQFKSEHLSSDAGAVTSNFEQVRVGQAIYLSGSLFNHSCIPNIHAYFVSRVLLIRATEYVLAGCPLELSYGPQVGQWDYRRRQQFLLDNYSFKCECYGCARINFSDLALSAFHCVKPNCYGVVLADNTIEYERHRICHLQNEPGDDHVEQHSEVNKLYNDDLKNMVSLLFEQNNYSHAILSGCCLKCGSTRDLKSLHEKVEEADVSIRSLQENKINHGCLSNALSHLDVLKSALHPYNKKLAEAEDIFAEAFSSVGEMQKAIEHCLASIRILEKIYSPGHIVLGNELVKLASLQIALADVDAAVTVDQMDKIFSNYYGRHAELMFPYLQHLKEEVHKLSDEGPS